MRGGPAVWWWDDVEGVAVTRRRGKRIGKAKRLIRENFVDLGLMEQISGDGVFFFSGVVVGALWRSLVPSPQGFRFTYYRSNFAHNFAQIPHLR